MKNSITIELAFFSVLFLLLNAHLFTGEAPSAFIYRPGQSGPMGGAALILHPFVHVTRYHFLLDAGAFLMLWPGVGKNVSRRAVYLVTSAVASFAAVHFWAPRAAVPGFCGLSGIGHGLMAVFCLEMAMDKSTRCAGLVSLAAVATKPAYEMLTGNVFFSAMHMGLCGHPVPESHAGGLLGGVIAFVVMNRCKSITHKGKPIKSAE